MSLACACESGAKLGMKCATPRPEETTIQAPHANSRCLFFVFSKARKISICELDSPARHCWVCREISPSFSLTDQEADVLDATWHELSPVFSGDRQYCWHAQIEECTFLAGSDSRCQPIFAVSLLTNHWLRFASRVDASCLEALLACVSP